MKVGMMIAVAAALSIEGPVQAATDAGLTLPNGPFAGRSTATGGGITMRARWDAVGRRNAPRMSAVELSAGPMLSIRDRAEMSGFRRGIAPVASLTFGPRDGASFRLVGRELGSSAASHANEENDKKKGKQSTGDKVAWVAAVAGGVMVALAGAAFIVLSSQGPTD